jgi:hypothetical protein
MWSSFLYNSLKIAYKCPFFEHQTTSLCNYPSK